MMRVHSAAQEVGEVWAGRYFLGAQSTKFQNYSIQEAMESSAFPSNLQCMLIFCQMAHTQKNPNVILLQFSWATKVP